MWGPGFAQQIVRQPRILHANLNQSLGGWMPKSRTESRLENL